MLAYIDVLGNRTTTTYDAGNAVVTTKARGYTTISVYPVATWRKP